VRKRRFGILQCRQRAEGRIDVCCRIFQLEVILVFCSCCFGCSHQETTIAQAFHWLCLCWCLCLCLSSEKMKVAYIINKFQRQSERKPWSHVAFSRLVLQTLLLVVFVSSTPASYLVQYKYSSRVANWRVPRASPPISNQFRTRAPVQSL
jgi:hypothetical protein